MENPVNIQQLIASMAIEKPKAAAPIIPNAEEIADEAVKLHKAGYMPYDPQAFENLAKWLAKRKNKAFKKGLLVTGNPGTGKTLFLKHLFPKFKTAIEIVQVFRSEGGNYTNTFWKQTANVYDSASHEKDMAIDDLGQEPIVNLFGTKTEVLDYVICKRYADWQKTGVITLITTNLKQAEMEERYKRRITDRLAEMCELIKIDGGSNR
jgi:predicted ATPase